MRFQTGHPGLDGLFARALSAEAMPSPSKRPLPAREALTSRVLHACIAVTTALAARR